MPEPRDGEIVRSADVEYLEDPGGAPLGMARHPDPTPAVFLWPHHAEEDDDDDDE